MNMRQESLGSLTGRAHALIMCHLISFDHFQLNKVEEKNRWKTKQLYRPEHAIISDPFGVRG